MDASHNLDLERRYPGICNECGGQYPHHHDGCVTLKTSVTERCRHGNVKWRDGEEYYCEPCDRVEPGPASAKQVGGDHYRDMEIQPSEFIYRNKLNWLQGNAIKYICRHNRKHGAQDLDKAIHYLELLKEWEYDRDRQSSKRADQGT